MRESYHWLPPQEQKERDEHVVRLFDLGVSCAGIASIIGKDYETARKILRKAGRMGKDKGNTR